MSRCRSLRKFWWPKTFFNREKTRSLSTGVTLLGGPLSSPPTMSSCRASGLCLLTGCACDCDGAPLGACFALALFEARVDELALALALALTLDVDGLLSTGAGAVADWFVLLAWLTVDLLATRGRGRCLGSGDGEAGGDGEGLVRSIISSSELSNTFCLTGESDRIS